MRTKVKLGLILFVLIFISILVGLNINFWGLDISNTLASLSLVVSIIGIFIQRSDSQLQQNIKYRPVFDIHEVNYDDVWNISDEIYTKNLKTRELSSDNKILKIRSQLVENGTKHPYVGDVKDEFLYIVIKNLKSENLYSLSINKNILISKLESAPVICVLDTNFTNLIIQFTTVSGEQGIAIWNKEFNTITYRYDNNNYMKKYKVSKETIASSPIKLTRR